MKHRLVISIHFIIEAKTKFTLKASSSSMKEIEKAKKTLVNLAIQQSCFCEAAAAAAAVASVCVALCDNLPKKEEEDICNPAFFVRFNEQNILDRI